MVLTDEKIKVIDREVEAEMYLATGVAATDASRQIQHDVMRGNISFAEGLQKLVDVATEEDRKK